MGVIKWEPTVDFSATAMGNIGRPPPFIRNPGWVRIQNVASTVFSRAKRNKIWQITEKLDGHTMHVYRVAKESKWFTCIPELLGGYPKTMRSEHSHVGVCGRAMDFVDNENNLFWRAAKESGVLQKIHSIGYPK